MVGRLLDRIKQNHREFMATGHVRFALMIVAGIATLLLVVGLVLKLTQ